MAFGAARPKAWSCMPTRQLKTEGEGHSFLLLLCSLGRSEQRKGVGEKTVERHLADDVLHLWTEQLDEGSWISNSVNDCLPLSYT